MQNSAGVTANEMAGFSLLFLKVATFLKIPAFFFGNGKKLCFKRRAQPHISIIKEKTENDSYPKPHAKLLCRVREQDTIVIQVLMSVVFFL